MLSFFSLNRISNAHFLFKNTLFVLYLPIFKDEQMSLLLILKKCYCSQRTFLQKWYSILHIFFCLTRSCFLRNDYFSSFLLCRNWWYFTIDLISQHTIIESFENRSETSSNMSSWFNVWFSSYFTLSILHVPPYIM